MVLGYQQLTMCTPDICLLFFVLQHPKNCRGHRCQAVESTVVDIFRYLVFHVFTGGEVVLLSSCSQCLIPHDEVSSHLHIQMLHGLLAGLVSNLVQAAWLYLAQEVWSSFRVHQWLAKDLHFIFTILNV